MFSIENLQPTIFGAAWSSENKNLRATVPPETITALPNQQEPEERSVFLRTPYDNPKMDQAVKSLGNTDTGILKSEIGARSCGTTSIHLL
jgi:hypothetical protein